MNRPVIELALLVLLLAPAILFAHDRPAGPLHKTRSAVLARHGLAATSQPLATEVAIDVLRRGGNAIDAAIAANAVQGVVEPQSCGIGGDLFAIIWDAKSQQLYGLNASGRSPAAATHAHFETAQLEAIPTYGPLSWSVPGCVDGWAVMAERFGSKPLAELLKPAIQYAEEGFPVSEIIAGAWKESEALLRDVPTSAACYLPSGRAPAYGEVFTNPGLARTLRWIADGGRAAFYNGPIADAIVAYSREVGGLFSREDFEVHTSTWVNPVSTTYRGYEVWELPPNGQGIAVLQMLNLLEPYDLPGMKPHSPEALHLMIEAKKLAFEDRARYYADPEFSTWPVDVLISKSYARQRAESLDPDHASHQPLPGNLPQSDTIYLTVVDGEGNCVSLIQSVFHHFGSQHVPGELGFALQNRGSSFALDPGHANSLEPRKRPFHTIIPGFVTKDGQPWLSFGVMGGDMQPQGHVQVLCNLIDWGMDVQQAGDAPRFRHFGSSEPTGAFALEQGGVVQIETGIAPEVADALRAMGHQVEYGGIGGFGGYQAIRIDLERGVLMGGSDPRKDGAAAGY